ncbi:hypothetical protein Tco_0622567 [Tanacetum coccineum]
MSEEVRAWSRGWIGRALSWQNTTTREYVPRCLPQCERWPLSHILGVGTPVSGVGNLHIEALSSRVQEYAVKVGVKKKRRKELCLEEEWGFRASVECEWKWGVSVRGDGWCVRVMGSAGVVGEVVPVMGGHGAVIGEVVVVC